ncbi:GIY-YIG nuclease family protein, partial [Candidatus Uhrbacteria bacterium]|nr:GIY-YIG nuclease family protein [Candidatus Uhrbacteria bacterium]
MTKQLLKQLQQLPATPGVYQFYDSGRKLLYIGKASILKSRVASYFRSEAALSAAKQELVRQIHRLKYIETTSEIEALLLEASLIKQYHPPFNVLMRDDKSYVYIKVSTEEEWPRVLATRKLDKAGTYFGPFTSSNAVRETLRVLRKIIPYRCNSRPIASRVWQLASGQKLGASSKKVRACLWFHLGRCPGTCVGAISKIEYRKNIRRITLFLGGKMDMLRRALKKEMGPERVALMENVLAHTRLIATGEKFAYDAVALARVLHLSKPPERIEGYDISNTSGREATGAMVVFKNGEPEKSEYKRFKIKTVQGADDTRMLAEVLARRLQHSLINSKFETLN